LVAGISSEAQVKGDKKQYHLRMLDRFFLFDPGKGMHVSREWTAGTVVTAPADVALLEQYAAPVERIIETSEGYSK
jgi:hypothetical protein